MLKLTRPECPNPQALAHDYAHPDNKEALRKSTQGKCMYCESIIDATGAQVEHIKPKSKYPQYEFNWENLGYACPACNRTKWEKYDENCPFINPYIEDPQALIFWDEAVAFANTPRGKYTIEEIGLDCDGLIMRRREKLAQINKLLAIIAPLPENNPMRQKLIDEIKQEALPIAEYSAAVKSYLVKEGIL